MRKVSPMTPEDRASLVKEIQSRVDELTFPELANLSQKAKNEELSKIYNTVKKYLIEYNIAEKNIANKSQTLNLIETDNKNLQMYILYKTLLTTDISRLLEDGYILIETLRYAFTGQQITYEIGMEYSVGKNQKQLIEKTISLAELLSFAAPDIQWRGFGMAAFKLRARSYKSDFEVEYNKYYNSLEQNLNNLHSLWPRVQGIINGTYGTKQNIGNVFEVYRGLRAAGYAPHPPGPKDPQQLSADEVVEKYMDVKRGTQSFVSGGDIGLSQVKLLSASPSIASLNTIGNALKLILSYLEQGMKADVKIEDIKNKVFSKEFDRLSREGIKEMIETIDEELSFELDTKKIKP